MRNAICSLYGSFTVAVVVAQLDARITRESRTMKSSARGAQLAAEGGYHCLPLLYVLAHGSSRRCILSAFSLSSRRSFSPADRRERRDRTRPCFDTLESLECFVSRRRSLTQSEHTRRYLHRSEHAVSRAIIGLSYISAYISRGRVCISSRESGERIYTRARLARRDWLSEKRPDQRICIVNARERSIPSCAP
jgi:hypothetical protein